MDQSRKFPSFAAAVAIATVFLQPVSAQSPVIATSFDVASIRQNTASDGHQHIYNDPAESHLRVVNLSGRSLLQYAYGLPESQILGGPPWIDSPMFDIDAKSDAAV
ncbi:MAG: TIGR03435 family protein, partial [Acidobacteriota bacterium]|nr:TIGR03435 family protein [Acidobacteriota bacterium]